MKKNAILTLTAIAFLSSIAATQVFAGDHREQLEALVEEYIAACESKSELLDSTSDNIRRAAQYACAKGSLCKTLKSELIDELEAKDIAPLKHKVYYFLNVRFKEMAGTDNLL